MRIKHEWEESDLTTGLLVEIEFAVWNDDGESLPGVAMLCKFEGVDEPWTLVRLDTGSVIAGSLAADEAAGVLTSANAKPVRCLDDHLSIYDIGILKE